MKKHWLLLLSFAFFLLLFIQVVSVFIEAIYILELLSTSLDEKVLGVLFFFSPILLFPFGKRVPRWLLWAAFVFLFIGRGISPYLATTGRMLSAGMASAAGLILLPLMLAAYRDQDDQGGMLIPAQGFALAVGMSVLLRTLNYTIDPTLTSAHGWIGWLLGIGFGLTLVYFKGQPAQAPARPVKGITPAAVGVMGLLTMFYFMLSSPGVVARWTEGSYVLIISLVSLVTLAWFMSALTRPGWMARIKPGLLLIWNLVFTGAVVGTILVHTIQFPTAPEAPAVVVTSPEWYLQIPLLVMLLTLPVIYIDFAVFSGLIAQTAPTPRKLAPGFLLGAFLLVIFIFMNIFSNVWGYVEPISPFFRNKFWLSFLLPLGMAAVLGFVVSRKLNLNLLFKLNQQNYFWPVVISGVIFLATSAAALLTDRTFVEPPGSQSLRVMTYNIQQANDELGEKSYLGQLALIRQVDPDIIGIQESDSARISLGNNDYIRYYANQLGYHAYYGPKTVTGTYGTAILSKYPLENPRSVFSFSDQDEIGTAEAEITVGERQFTIFNVHPDGSDEAKLVFAMTLVERADQKPDVIAVGDYNLRGWEAAYLLVDEHYKNAWMDVYPSGIDDQGLDMSGRARIDHIFISPHLQVWDPVYLLPPASRTDHPVHWADISWE